MEKYLFILIIAIICYYLYTCLNVKENFADVSITETSAVDETNAINILAKIAADLQSGKGLRVLGDLNVDKSVKITGAKTTPANAGDKMTWFNHADGNNYIRGNTYVSGNLYLPYTKADVIQLGDKFLLSGVGDGHANDGWLRMLNKENKQFYGGFAANELYTATGNINGRNIFAELDALRRDLDYIRNNAVIYGQNASVQPNNDAGRCFDFGSQGRTGCDNSWSVMKITKR